MSVQPALFIFLPSTEVRPRRLTERERLWARIEDLESELAELRVGLDVIVTMRPIPCITGSGKSRCRTFDRGCDHSGCEGLRRAVAAAKDALRRGDAIRHRRERWFEKRLAMRRAS